MVPTLVKFALPVLNVVTASAETSVGTEAETLWRDDILRYVLERTLVFHVIRKCFGRCCTRSLF
jgi:hypothetical protein